MTDKHGWVFSLVRLDLSLLGISSLFDQGQGAFLPSGQLRTRFVPLRTQEGMRP